MTHFYDPFSVVPGFDVEARIRERAGECGIRLTDEATTSLATHARAVLRENQQIHLTSISEPTEFFERHIGEAFEGAAMLPEDATGAFIDIGSGNGYPGLPIAASRPGLSLLMAESSVRKAEFLRSVIRDAPFPTTAIVETQVQRATDLEVAEPVRLITSRAMGGWPKILPRLRTWLGDESDLLVWAGDDVDRIAQRKVWRRFRLEEKRPLPGRDASWICRFRVAPSP